MASLSSSLARSPSSPMIRSWTAALIRWSLSASGRSARFALAGIAAASARFDVDRVAATRSARVGDGAGAGVGAATGRGAGAAGGRCTEGVGREAGPLGTGRTGGGGVGRFWGTGGGVGRLWGTGAAAGAGVWLLAGAFGGVGASPWDF